jgi:hypothetical protein
MAIRVDRILMEVWNCVAIERTTETETRGKYILIFQEKDMEKAKASIGELIEAYGRNSNRASAKLALEKFQEFPEFDSIQRVSQSVQTKGLRIREMLETAAAQRTKSTPQKAKQPKFQFHVNKELQKQLHISTNKTYGAVMQQTPQRKKLMIVQTQQQQLQSIIRQQQTGTSTQTKTQTNGMNTDGKATQQMELNEQGMGISKEEWEEAAQRQGTSRARIMTNVTQESRTVATNNSGLSLDQQTITTMMTQITQQFKEMERERITREERQEMKRQEREAKAEEKREEREARIEEKRIEAQKEMYSFMQTMMTININKNNNREEQQRKELIPDELTTGTTGQTSAITTSIVTTSTTPSTKRSSSQLSNTDEETEMEDKEAESETQENNEIDLSIKRNKTITEGEEDNGTIEQDEEMITDKEHIEREKETSTVTDVDMTDKEGDKGSFVDGFNNQQFQTTTNNDHGKGGSQQ